MEQELQTKANADEVPVITPSVTDAELDAAAEGKAPEEITEEPKEEPKEEAKAEEQPKPEPTPEEIAAQEEHKERSRLGRKLAKVEEELLEQRKQTNELMQLLRAKFEPKEEKPPDLPEYITTPEELEKYLNYRDQQRVQKQQEYHQNYAKTVYGFKANDADAHAEILKEMDANFRNIPTGNPLIDAQINYSQAKAAYFSKLAAAKKVEREVPVKGGQPEVPTGLSGNSRVTSKSPSLPKLDKVAQEYVDYLRSLGKKEDQIVEFINKTLEGEAPAYIGQR